MRLLRTTLLIGLTLLAGITPMVQPALAQPALVQPALAQPALVQPALAQTGAEPGSLRAMIQLVPLLPLGGDAQAMLTYADLAQQAEAVGVAAPETNQDEPATADWVRAVTALYIHSKASYFASPEWGDVFGFDLYDIDQIIEYSAPPTSVTVVRGRFDPEDLISHWEAAGYEAREDGAYYSIANDFEINIQSDGGRMVLAAANYMAILAPDTIAFAPAENLITAALDLAAGTGKSLANEINIASLLEGVPDDLVSGVIYSGTVLLALGDPAISLTGTPDPENLDAMATRMAEDMAEAAAMPPLTAVLLGMSAGGPVESLETSSLAPDDIPAAQAIAVVVTTNDAAAWTVAEVVDTRLRGSDGPLTWSEFFAGWSVHVVEEEPVVRIELELAPDRPPSILHQMLSRRELGFLGWLP